MSRYTPWIEHQAAVDSLACVRCGLSLPVEALDQMRRTCQHSGIWCRSPLGRREPCSAKLS